MDTSHDFYPRAQSEWREHERKGKRTKRFSNLRRENVGAKRVTQTRKIEREKKEERWLIPQCL